MLVAAAALLAAVISSDPYISDCGPQPSTECVQRALKLDGAVAIGVPGLAAARKAAFMAITDCIDRPRARQSVITLPDGTSRATFGTRTIAGLPEPLEGCPEAEDDIAAIRALVDTASRRFLELVQPLMRSDTGLLRADSGGDSLRYSNLADVARSGEQLEHFHVYEPAVDTNASAVTTSSEPAVPLHTDAGLFIAIVPAMHVGAPVGQGGRFAPLPTPLSSAPADVAAEGSAVGGAPLAHDGFYVQTWDGSRARVRAPPDAPPLVFVLGDGWATWLNPLLRAPLRAAPHAMVMPRRIAPLAAAGGGRVARVWFGRMFLPPADAVLHPKGQPFAAWRAFHAAHPVAPSAAAAAAAASAGPGDGAYEADAPANATVHVMPSGCAGGRRYLTTTDNDGCLANQILCWHQCMSVANLPCGQEALCQDPSSGHVWTPDEPHCVGCIPQCPAPSTPPPSPAPPLPPAPPGGWSPSPPAVPPSPPPPSPEVPFCTGPGTAMHMSGFEYYPADCVIFLFNGWVLDAPGTFVLAILGSLGLGLLTELLTFLRREKIAKAAALRERPNAFVVVMGSIFTVQVTLGYLLMLVAMTYQVELFVAVMLGLGGGHMLLNVKAPVGESVEACCVDAVESEKGKRPSPAPEAKLTRTNNAMGSSGLGVLVAPLGSSARLDGTRLSITPVTCDGCVKRVTATLLALPVIKRVTVTKDPDAPQPTGTAVITWASDAVQPQAQQAALAAIEALDKSATVVSGGDGGGTSFWLTTGGDAKSWHEDL